MASPVPHEPHPDASSAHIQHHPQQLLNAEAAQPVQLSTTRSSESKPRLSKEAQDLLERHFAAEPKPSTNTKKGFAGELGVPLDKINNWFQNRRAKVKQDAKKARNQQSYDLLYHNAYSSDGLHTESFINPSFYTTIDPTVPHPMLIHDPGMQMPPDVLIAPFQNGPQLSHNSTNSTTPSTHFPSFGSYNPDPVMGAYFGLDDGSSIANGQPIDPSSVAAFGNQFKQPFSTATPMSNLDAADEGLALYSINSNDSSSYFQHPPAVGHHAMHASARHPSSSMNSMTTGYSAASRNSSTSWASPLDMDNPNLPFNLRAMRDRMDSIQNNVNQTVHEEPVADFDVLHPSYDQDTSLPTSHESLTATTAAMDLERTLAIDTSMTQTCPAPAMVYPTTECGSSGSRSDHLSPGPSSSSDAGPSPTNTVVPRSSTSSLAARRQKRPAALGLAAIRSTSFTAGLPSSPGSATTNITMDQASLRRIKSSNYVMSGRVHKSSANLPLKSPMGFSFRESEQSPRFLRQFSSTSRLPDNPDLHAAHAIPEHEAEDVAGAGAHEDAASIWNQMPSTAGTAHSSAQWSQAPPTGESGYGFVSPPVTPHELHHFEQMRMRNASMPDMQQHHHHHHHRHHHHHMAPMSPQPWEQSFVTGAPPTSIAASTDLVFRPSSAGHATTASPLGPAFAERMAANISASDAYMPSTPAIHASGNFPSGHSRQQQHLVAPDGVPPGQIPMFPVASDLSMMPPPAPVVPSSEHLNDYTVLSRAGSELQIQAYKPRDAVDAADLAPKRPSSSQPRNYQFNNQFADTFVSP